MRMLTTISSAIVRINASSRNTSIPGTAHKKYARVEMSAIVGAGSVIRIHELQQGPER